MISKFAETEFAKKAIREKADLNEFKKKPNLRILMGVLTILMSYIICWPLISLLGATAIYLKKPLIVAIGGPVAYGLSHLTFILGMYLSGAYYSKVFLLWAARVGIEKAALEKNLNKKEDETINK